MSHSSPSSSSQGSNRSADDYEEEYEDPDEVWSRLICESEEPNTTRFEYIYNLVPASAEQPVDPYCWQQPIAMSEYHHTVYLRVRSGNMWCARIDCDTLDAHFHPALHSYGFSVFEFRQLYHFVKELRQRRQLDRRHRVLGGYQIAECIYDSDDEFCCYAVLKTHWIRLIQRTWKRVCAARRDCLARRRTLAAQKYRECRGTWPADCQHLPRLRGLLSQIAGKRKK